MRSSGIQDRTPGLLCRIDQVALEVTLSQASRRIYVGAGQEHLFHVCVNEINVFWIVDGVQPDGSAKELNQNDVSQRARTKTSGNGQMKAAANATFLPLTLELIQRQRWEAFINAPAAAALADE
jgi:hypothetical protein